MTSVDTRPEAGNKTRTPLLRRPWIGPLMLIAAAFMAYSVPRYLTLDPARTNVPAPEGFPQHYWLLSAHVVFGTVAMTTACFQIWPAFRNRYPRAHRIMGRLYVLAGVVPGALLAVTVGAVSPFGPVVRVANVLMGLIWLAVTIAGFRAARARRLGDHRRWMIRGFALTFAIITTRFLGVVAAIALYSGDEDLATASLSDVRVQTFTAIGVWVGFTLHLALAQLWLDRRNRRRAR
ncbi:hypothetical protein Afil01_26080 [Actinorhabdospora filicis]|uniref:DUF2306 domain-containing protein n=1 Tax=Actinorhabdospora filicis TaxID=1785913 RepID=A0A9W6SNG0_9ACTN|nr:DUF2306 domain-containing protein [Actinorhabdospora filicis]GLZ77801.1 hypothetical protein Afil01_26080 [Actinorhabdospora filicis]